VQFLDIVAEPRWRVESASNWSELNCLSQVQRLSVMGCASRGVCSWKWSHCHASSVSLLRIAFTGVSFCWIGERERKEKGTEWPWRKESEWVKGCCRDQSSSSSTLSVLKFVRRSPACSWSWGGMLFGMSWLSAVRACVRTLAKPPCPGPVTVAVGEAGRKPEKPGINGIHSMSPVAEPHYRMLTMAV